MPILWAQDMDEKLTFDFYLIYAIIIIESEGYDE